MRLNLPVTSTAYELAPGQTLVSVTDTKGRITYCNTAFVSASGYQASELLGEPHNIVRHPDMPEEAFRDMWDSIQQKLPWTGLVKNRRKNGDYYWVRANATPMLDGDQITGYLSVRTAPSRDEIAKAEMLYAIMTKEAHIGKKVHSLRQGRVVRRDLIGKFQNLFHPELTAKLALIQVAAMTVMLIVLGIDVVFLGRGLGILRCNSGNLLVHLVDDGAPTQRHTDGC